MSKDKKKDLEPKKIEPVEAPKPSDSEIDFSALDARIDSKLDAFFERMQGIMVHSPSHAKAVDDEYINHGRSVLSGELGKDTTIEPINEQDIAAGAVEMEAFMNQRLLINIMKSADRESLPVVIPNVNGVNHPILRGVDTLVKRKFVEVLARCRDTKYEQRIDKFNPEKFIMAPSTAIKDPFVVKHDPHPHGNEWLDIILREAS